GPGPDIAKSEFAFYLFRDVRDTPNFPHRTRESPRSLGPRFRLIYETSHVIAADSKWARLRQEPRHLFCLIGADLLCALGAQMTQAQAANIHAQWKQSGESPCEHPIQELVRLAHSDDGNLMGTYHCRECGE